MTNEELAAAVQAGDRDALLTLWEQVGRLAAQQARRWECVGGLELDDLMQNAFIATMEAADTYDGSAAFSTWLVIHIKREFTSACYQRTERQRREPLLNAVSLSAPVGEGFDDDETALEDMIEDPSAAAAMEAVDERDRLDRLHAVLMEAIDKLSPAQQEAIIGRYWKGEKVRNIHHEHAIKRLRHPMVSKKLTAYR